MLESEVRGEIEIFTKVDKCIQICINVDAYLHSDVYYIQKDCELHVHLHTHIHTQLHT